MEETLIKSNSEPDPRSRLKIAVVTQDAVLTTLMGFPDGNHFMNKITNLPKDARINGVYYNVAKGAFDVVIHSMEFDPVPEGQEMPTLMSEFEIMKIKVGEDAHESS